MKLADGYYWYREMLGEPWQVVKISNPRYSNDAYVAFCGTDCDEMLQDVHGEFGPKLEEPI